MTSLILSDVGNDRNQAWSATAYSVTFTIQLLFFERCIKQPTQVQYNCNTTIFLVLQLYCTCAEPCDTTAIQVFYKVGENLQPCGHNMLKYCSYHEAEKLQPIITPCFIRVIINAFSYFIFPYNLSILLTITDATLYKFWWNSSCSFVSLCWHFTVRKWREYGKQPSCRTHIANDMIIVLFNHKWRLPVWFA